MFIRSSYLLVLLSVALLGCASGLAVSGDHSASTLRLVADEGHANSQEVAGSAMPRPPVEPIGAFVAVGDGQPYHGQVAELTTGVSIPDSATRQLESGPPSSQMPLQAVEIVAQSGDQLPALGPVEEVVTPAPESRFKDSVVDEQYDRFARQVTDVPVDIRPPAGEMPEDLGAEKYAAEPIIDETFPSDQTPDIFCSYTPWTICYRPLYFEDIALERYGKNVGCLQTGLSGVRFFGSIAALPYKMTRRPPRSCQCSNGFSRPGDCPLPGYGNRRFQWDAALVEAAVVTAFVYIIP